MEISKMLGTLCFFTETISRKLQYLKEEKTNKWKGTMVSRRRKQDRETRAQLQQKVKDLEREKREREEATRKQIAILNAWYRMDPDGTRY